MRLPCRDARLDRGRPLAGVFAAAGSAFTPSDLDGSHPAYARLNSAAWEMTTGSPNVVVAVVDFGIDPSHADLAGAVLPGYDFADRDTDPSDAPGGHGTAVSGVAAASRTTASAASARASTAVFCRSASSAATTSP